MVRRGRKTPVVIFRTPDSEFSLAQIFFSMRADRSYIGGWGIRSAERIKANTFVMEYVGMVFKVDSEAAAKNVGGIQSLAAYTPYTCGAVFRSRLTSSKWTPASQHKR